MSLQWFSNDFCQSIQQLANHIITSGYRYLLAFVLSLVIALELTPVFRKMAIRLGMMDTPDSRRINLTPIPRGGGLSIIIAFFAVLWLLVWMQGNQLDFLLTTEKLGALSLASLLLATVGFIDDYRGIPPLVKLIGQIAVASLLFVFGFQIEGIVVAFPPWLDYLVTVFWIVGAINAFNLIDGLDGLATGLALIAAIGLAGSMFFTGNSSSTLPYIVFAGACLGFLRYNFHPASVFLGDTGSMFLGMIIATLPLLTGSRKELMTSLGMPLLVMGVPIFDTFLAIWRRTVRHFLPQRILDQMRGTGEGKEGVMQPDKDHLHHRLLRRLMNNQRKVAITLYLLAVLFTFLGLGGVLMKNRAPGLFFLAFVTATIVVIRNFECIELFDTGKLLSAGRMKRSRFLEIPLAISIDMILLCLCWFLAWFITIDEPISRMTVLQVLPIFVVPAFISLSISKIYRRIWLRAQIRDYIVLATALILGAIVSLGIIWLWQGDRYHLIRFTFLFACTSILSLCFIRSLKECAVSFMQIFSRNVLTDQATTKRILVYGGGLRLRGFLRELYSRKEAVIDNHRMILGILDDDPQLRGRLIAGYAVLGTGEEMEAIIDAEKVDEVVVTCVMSVEKQKDISRRLRAKNVQATHWICDEVPL